VERIEGIGGVFFRARDPQALREWYARVLGIELTDFGGAILVAGDGDVTVWSLFEADTDYFGTPQQAMVNYRVRDLDAMLEQLRANGVEPEPVQEHENGRFSWATDPEGNRFELWEPLP
jgi:predicted enzyme related to lactoylglutathione lyase